MRFPYAVMVSCSARYFPPKLNSQQHALAPIHNASINLDCLKPNCYVHTANYSIGNGRVVDLDSVCFIKRVSLKHVFSTTAFSGDSINYTKLYVYCLRTMTEQIINVYPFTEFVKNSLMFFVIIS